MTKQLRPTVRYFARFKGDIGHLRAAVRYGNSRKYVTTPLIIERDMLPYLDSMGRIDYADMPGTCDVPANLKTRAMMLNNRLRNYDAVARRVVQLYADNGAWDALSGADITQAIADAVARDEDATYKRLQRMAEESLRERRQEAAKMGVTIQHMTLDDFTRLIQELKAKLTPAEYNALWVKGGDL